MSNIRKGSIVYHKRHKVFMKALTSSKHGELTDQLTFATGKLYDHHLKGHVLIEKVESIEHSTYKNKPCYICSALDLLPQKEYLEIQTQLTIKSN